MDLRGVQATVDGNYWVITLIFKEYGNLPLCLENYVLFQLPPIYTKKLYTLRYIIYLGEPSGNIISNYHGTFIHIYMHWYDPMFNIYIWNSFFPRVMLPFFLSLSFFLPKIHLKLFHFLQVGFFISVDIIEVSVLLSTTSQSSSTFHSFFNKEKTSEETETRLDFISYIWDDDHILRLDGKNWQWLWCNTSFQWINATKALAHVLGEKGMHIKSCCVPKDKSHITRYQ